MNETAYKTDERIDCDFIRLPAVFIKNERYRTMSTDAMVLYSLLLDRVSLSQQNDWTDDDGSVYIIYPRDEAAEKLNISFKKTLHAFKELSDNELLFEVRQGLGKPNLLYLQKPKNGMSRSAKNGMSRSAKTACQEMPKRHTIKTDNINTDYIKTENQSFCQKDGQTDDIFLETVKSKCELEIFDEVTASMLEGAIERIYYSDSLKVGGAALPRDKLRSALTNLDAEALIRVVDNMKSCQLNVKRPMAYVMSAIVNAAFDTHADDLLSLPSP